MKRLSILLVAIVAFSISSFAQQGIGEQYNVLWVLNNTSTANDIAKYVNASPEQAQEMNNIYYASVQRLTEALTSNSKEKAENALYFNIANVKAVLTPTQYRKYLAILNKTFYSQQVKFESVADK
ncbi:hypothetical protein GGR21_001975 [Dysgonomonas hofstadii]|uniref:Uncharacterized protein n=1 Tax=Dysgonomonas hofstadii TaxID=637886 RepID=A0A840CR49_9BACT|nr:hypothetical protein [Dysgonomonas hofstadii]MBB4036074.1 hypothetical protein [Dysgonomonas hofstadii]